MKTFIRVTEIWVPSRDRTALEFSDGLYGELSEFRAVSERTRFAYDEGLPGKAWASGQPVILKQFENSYFRRTEAARAVGLTCGIALPVFAGDILLAVLVFLCGDDAAHVGAVELWRNDPAQSEQMALVDGYYGTADLFEWRSRHSQYGRGVGLPGRVWDGEMPTLARDFVGPRQLLRWQDRQEAGVTKALGLPFRDGSGRSWVISFLSALNTPIARRFEIWAPDADRRALVFREGDDDGGADLAALHRDAAVAPGEGLLGTAWRSGVPAVQAGRTSEPGGPDGADDSTVVLPVLEAGRVKAVVAWYF